MRKPRVLSATIPRGQQRSGLLFTRSAGNRWAASLARRRCSLGGSASCTCAPVDSTLCRWPCCSRSGRSGSSRPCRSSASCAGCSTCARTPPGRRGKACRCPSSGWRSAGHVGSTCPGRTAHDPGDTSECTCAQSPCRSTPRSPCSSCYGTTTRRACSRPRSSGWRSIPRVDSRRCCSTRHPVRKRGRRCNTASQAGPGSHYPARRSSRRRWERRTRRRTPGDQPADGTGNTCPCPADSSRETTRRTPARPGRSSERCAHRGRTPATARPASDPATSRSAVRRGIGLASERASSSMSALTAYRPLAIDDRLPRRRRRPTRCVRRRRRVPPSACRWRRKRSRPRSSRRVGRAT